MSLLLNEQIAHTKSSGTNWYTHFTGGRVIGDFSEGNFVKFSLSGLTPGRYTALIAYIAGEINVKLSTQSWENSLTLPHNTPGTFSTEVQFFANTDFLKFENTDPSATGSLESIQLTLIEAFETPMPTVAQTVLRPIDNTVSGTAVAGSTARLYRDGQVVATTTADAAGNYSFTGLLIFGGEQFQVSAQTAAWPESEKTAALVALFGNMGVAPPIQRNNCHPDYSGSIVYYSVDANKYFGSTMAEAQALVQQEIQTLGQAYANQNGYCTLKPQTATPSLPTSLSPGSAITGKSAAGATVRLYLDGQVIASTTADAGGNYSFSNVAVSGGQVFQVSAQGTDERESVLSAAVRAKYINQTLSFELFNRVCQQFYKPLPYTYVVQAGKYLGDTQADADAMALQDIQTIGQNLANTNGVCLFVPQTPMPVLDGNEGDIIILTTYLDPTILQLDGAGTPGATMRLFRDGELTDMLVIPETGYFSFFLRPVGGCTYALTAQLPDLRESVLSDPIVSWCGNAEKSLTLRCSDCRYRYRGSEVTYTVPANRYIAETQAEADESADAEINENAQYYADEVGICELLPPPFLIDPAVPGMEFLPIRMVRNTLLHNIPEADPATYPERESLRYFLEILEPEYFNAPVFERLTVLKGTEKPPYNQAGVTIYEGANFFYDRLIDGLLTYHKPEPEQNYISIAHGLTTPFRFREEIRNDGELIFEKNLETEYAIKAGLKERDSLTYAESYFTFRQAETWQFLTWQPVEKTTSARAEEYLYYLLNFKPVPKQVRIRVRVHFDDSTTQVLTVSNTRVRSYRLYQVICCPVGISALGLDKLAKPVRKYEVWLANEHNQQFTEVRTYHPNTYFEAQERHILFSNSLGGVDSLRLTGAGTENLRVQRNLAEVLRSDSSVQELRIISVQSNRSLTVQTGWLRRNVREWLSYMNELLLSENISLVDNKGHMGLILETSEMIDSRDDSELISLQLTFRYAHTERNYSNLPPADVMRERKTRWLPYGTPTCELDDNFRRTGRAIFPQIELVYQDTNEPVRPRQIKLNLEDDPDYVVPQLTSVCMQPKYLNAEMRRQGSFRKQDCKTQPYLVGGPVEIIIPAGRWGSETSQVEADARAEAEWQSLNTQVHADTFGTCELAPFVNVEIRRRGCYSRQGCPAPQAGGSAEIVVPAAAFGSMNNQAEADALAELEFRRLDTQAYANQHGVCGVPALYAWNVPAGHWHYRANRPDITSVHWWDGGDQSRDIGNVPWRYNPAIPYSFPGGSNDLDFPANSVQYPTDGLRWRLAIDGPNEGYTLNIFIDGDLQFTGQMAGLSYFHMPVAIIAGGKYYVEVV